MYERGVAIGVFFGYLRDLKLVIRSFMGFGVESMSVRPLQGESWVFGYLWGFL